MDPSCSLILAKEDYDRLYGPLDSPQFYQRTMGETLRRAQVILFLGYSHDDSYVARLFERSWEGVTDAPLYALVPRKERQDDFEARLAEQTRKHHINYISFSSANTYRELLQMLEYIKDPTQFDDLYKQRLSVKRPTVVFIRGGGTIGAKSIPTKAGRNLDIDHVSSRFDPDLHELAQTILRRYQRYSDIPIEIVWEILPKDHQLLSENAVVEDWNTAASTLHSCFVKYFEAPERVGPCALLHDPDIHELLIKEVDEARSASHASELTDLEFMNGFRNRYILGFVLLYGTDTLAFLASALSFGLRHIPCSVLITGANQALYSPNGPTDSEFESISDGWHNIFNCLTFLECVGHRLTELFVVFGDTIHHAVNLRKRAVDIIPFDREQIQQVDLEPFIYRNLSLTGQYMFRVIDGVLCNNYYASTTQSYRNILGSGKRVLDELSHLRPSPFFREGSALETPERFSNCVTYVELSPSFPTIDVPRMLQIDRELRVLLVEGYNSGTYPSVSAHAFALFLADLDKHGIPVVLISRYGIRATQEEYGVTQIDGRNVEVLRLFGMVVETALPLLSLVVGCIEDREWNRDAIEDAPPDDLATRRRGLIWQALRKFLEGRRNILSEELRYSLDRSARFKRMTELRQREEASRRTRDVGDGSLWRAPERQVTVGARGYLQLLRVPRPDFLGFVDGLIEQFDRVGALPDAFLTLNNQGFTLASYLAARFEARNPGPGHPWRMFAARARAEKDDLRTRAEALFADVGSRFQASGIGGVEFRALDLSEDPRSRQAYFIIEVKVDRGEAVLRTDERYTATALSDEEVNLFSLMNLGCSNEETAEEHEAAVKRVYNEAARSTWLQATHAVDWFVIGFFKGVACAVAMLLGFDKEGEEPPSASASVGRRQALRQAIRCEIAPIDTRKFGLRFRCSEQASWRVGTGNLSEE